MREGLLEHHQVETIEFSKQRNVSERERRVGIAHQSYIRKLLSDALNNLHVPTRFNFDLDALITRVNFLANLLQQDLRRVLNTN